MPLDERVLCIPTEHFRTVGYFHGFRRADDVYRDAILNTAQFQFLPRSQVETDPSFKQLIPYVVLRCRGALFHYRRGASGTEARLRALRSVGIGGHISEADAAGEGNPYQIGMRRELDEEVAIRGEVVERFFGFINDDRTPVGSVHLGVVHVFDLTMPDVSSREDAVSDVGFATVERLAGERVKFETWSQFVLDALLTDPSAGC